ncbi:hypothetical protein GBA52_007803 [Prunus armeniaca]|nr:hypothetical protein GBA52_007803 [Prunus armeniaca]
MHSLNTHAPLVQLMRCTLCVFPQSTKEPTSPRLQFEGKLKLLNRIYILMQHYTRLLCFQCTNTSPVPICTFHWCRLRSRRGVGCRWISGGSVRTTKG